MCSLSNLPKKYHMYFRTSYAEQGLVPARDKFVSCVKYQMSSFIPLTSFQIFGTFVSLVFLGQAFTIMLVYVWSRRNPNVRMNFFGLLNFQAPFLPWVLMGFSLLLGNSIIVDLLGTNHCPLQSFCYSFGIYKEPKGIVYDWWCTVWVMLVLKCFYLFRGIAVGHVYFFLEDVFPNQPGGGRWLKTPSIMWVSSFI